MTSILGMLRHYQPGGETEAADVARVRALAERTPDPYPRSLPLPLHVALPNSSPARLNAAAALSRRLYTASAQGRGVDQAVSVGRIAILGTRHNTLEWG